MKFLVDAQLPRNLAILLREEGFDTVHTSELTDGNNTTDGQINALSIAESRVVISKDGDFYNSFTAKKEPYKLLYVRVGNIKNEHLLDLFTKNLAAIVDELSVSDVITIDQRYIIALT